MRVDGGRYLPDVLGVRAGEKCDEAGFPGVEVFVEGAPRRPRAPHDIGDGRARVADLGNALLKGIKEPLAEVALVLVGPSLPGVSAAVTTCLSCRNCRQTFQT
jgi:hypothetical protein